MLWCLRLYYKEVIYCEFCLIFVFEGKFQEISEMELHYKEIRNELERLIEEKNKQPSLDISNYVLIETVTQLLSTDG